MANKKVLSVEIGSKFTRIAEVDYKIKNPRIYHTALMETPEGVMNDGTLVHTPDFVRNFKAKLSQSGMKSKQVIFTITSTKIASREILIPKVKDNRIAPLVAANASDYFPVDLSEYELAHFVVDTVRETVDTEKYKVMVYAMAKAMLDSYEKFALECGLTLVGVDYGGNSLYQMVKKECSEGISMIVRLNESASMATIVENGTMIMQRTVSYGIAGILDCYVEEAAEGCSYKQAMKALEETNYFVIPEEGAEGEDKKERFEKYVRAFNDAGLGISRIYDYYNSRNTQKPITKVYLTGIGANVSGLVELLAQRLDTEVVVLKTKGEYQVDKQHKGDINVYISCLGAALAPLGFIEARKELQKSTDQRVLSGKLLVYMIVCAAASVVILLVGLIPFIIQSSKKSENAAKVEELSSVIPVYQEYIQTKNASNYLEAAYEHTVLPTENLVDFIEEMEQKMPKDLYVTSFTANREGVAFSVVVNTKQQAADALLQLRTFESLTNINIESLSDTRGEDNSGVVAFSVTADYVNGKSFDNAPMEMDAAEEMIQEYEETLENAQ